MRNLSTAILIFFLSTSVASSNQHQDSLTIAISPFPPCIIIDDGGYSGFDIDLWEAIAVELDVPYVYHQVEFNDILDELISGRADLAIAGISITADREKIVDFSQHYLDSGLRIMVPSKGKIGFFSSIKSLFTPGIIRGILALFLFILLCGQVLWFSERGKDAINDHYFPGIFEAFWLVVTTITTVGYGDFAPRRWLGRIAASLVMLTGIGLFGLIIGEFAAAATIKKLASDISEPDDLRGKTVATVKATTSVGVLKDIGARIIETKHPEDSYKLLLKGEVDAVVYDAPVLLYYVNSIGKGKVSIVGEVFDQQYYGLALPEGSPLREDVNRALLKLRERKQGISAYDKIYYKWFGSLDGIY